MLGTIISILDINSLMALWVLSRYWKNGFPFYIYKNTHLMGSINLSKAYKKLEWGLCDYRKLDAGEVLKKYSLHMISLYPKISLKVGIIIFILQMKTSDSKGLYLEIESRFICKNNLIPKSKLYWHWYFTSHKINR